jgi:uncharacterized protein YbjT (DUF2867 family)
MMGKIALVAGGTGLVGQALVKDLCLSPAYSQIVMLVRKENTASEYPKVRQQAVHFDSLEASECKADDAFCCLGTTMKKAGSKEAFYLVDFTYVHRFATQCLQAGVKRFFLVTAMGADKHSFFYYNRVKGEIEEAVNAMPFEAIHVFRPSLLLGERKEQRLGEDLAKVLTRFTTPFTPMKYRGIQGATVARAMVNVAKAQAKGKFVYESDQLQKMGSF